MLQVMLLNAVKDVASALQDLMYSTKSASGKSIQDPAMHHLKDSAKVRQLPVLLDCQCRPNWQQVSVNVTFSSFGLKKKIT